MGVVLREGPPGYRLDTTNPDFLNRPDGTMVAAYLPEMANAYELRRRAQLDCREHYWQPMWERFQALERLLMEKRKDGQLGRMLGGPLPGESLEDLRGAVQQDRANVEQGVVELIKDGEVSYERLEELGPSEAVDRLRTEMARIEWILQRQKTKIAFYRKRRALRRRLLR